MSLPERLHVHLQTTKKRHARESSTLKLEIKIIHEMLMIFSISTAWKTRTGLNRSTITFNSRRRIGADWLAFVTVSVLLLFSEMASVGRGKSLSQMDGRTPALAGKL